MEQFVYVVTNPIGMHIGPAGALADTAAGFAADITLAKGDKSSNMKHIFSVMGLDARKGDTLVVHARGADEKEAIKQIASCLREHL